MIDRHDPRFHFDHLDRDVGIDPPETYRLLRATCPVAHSDRHGGFTVLSRYDDVRASARRWSVFSSEQIAIPGDRRRNIPITFDPPEHTRYRALLTEYFSAARVARLEPWLRRLTTESIDGFIERGSCDVSARLSQPVPTTLLLRVVGLSADEIGQVQPWIDTLVYETNPAVDRARRATLALQHCIGNVVRARRRERREDDDLMRLLLSAPVAGAPITDEEAINLLVTVIYAALGPTTFLVNGALLLLSQHPAVRLRLVARPDLLPGAIEEWLRYVSPVRSIGRRVKQPAHLFGHDFPVGEPVLLLWGSANRDETRFANPDELVLERRPNPHLAFGSGIHRCVGASLARLETRVIVEEVLSRLADYRVSEPPAIGWQVGHTSGINRLPIEFTPGPRRATARSSSR